MLEWNVFYNDINPKKITEFNVFEHGGFMDKCRNAAKKCGDDKAAFAEMVRGALMYHFWSKCEYEIILTSWPTHENSPRRKVDIYQQVMMNFDKFIDYLWDNIAFLRKHQKKK